MKLRKLNNSDAEWMLEWMHDTEVVQNLQTNFSTKTLADCLKFIDNSITDNENLHLAITDNDGIYMGTVSLKHINYKNRNAEFAITVRRSAMGKGYSQYGMKAILELARKELGLKTVYWCVSPKNIRAIRFYEKNEYKKCTDVPQELESIYQKGLQEKLIWYFVSLL